jgi:DUF1365 family protein
MIESGIYAGTLRHRRISPKRHEFTYPIFLALLDIDRLPELMRVSPLTGYERGNVISYQERDHFGDVRLPLRERLRLDAEKNNVAAPGGPVFLLTHLRMFGYNFNPVSFYYCYGAAGLDGVMAEVNNTFAETHNYWLTSPVAESGHHAKGGKRYQFEKKFHVSPFMGMQQSYDWTFTAPGDDLVVECMNFEEGEMVFDSTLKLERREWNAGEVHRAMREYPMMTARVIAGIYWEAVKLMLKGVPSVSHPGSGKFAARNTREFGASWKA